MVDATENIIDDVADADETSFIKSIIDEIIYSPVNVLLVSLIAFLIYKIIKSRSDTGVPNIPAEPELPKLRKDFTVQELKKYDGNQPDGRVLVAVNGHVYDGKKNISRSTYFRKNVNKLFYCLFHNFHFQFQKERNSMDQVKI